MDRNLCQGEWRLCPWPIHANDLFPNDFSTFNYSANGWLGGLTAGAQIQAGRTVLGLEAVHRLGQHYRLIEPRHKFQRRLAQPRCPLPSRP
jgi:hypothetical protein